MANAQTDLVVVDPEEVFTSGMSTIPPTEFGPIFNAAFQALRKLSVGNDAQLLQAMIAIASGEHILWIAGPGTGKSMTAELIMDMFPDARTLSLQLTKDTPQEAIFGHIIPKELIEEGREVRNLDGGLGDVEIGYLDEFMDASPWTIRTMLNVLNERVVRSKDGGEVDSPLHSVIATTNFFRNTGELEAVVDRFMAIAFMGTANQLHQHFRIGRGYTRTSFKDINLPQLNYADLLRFVEWIESPEGPEISDGMMTLHYVLLLEFLERRYKHELAVWADKHDLDLDDEENQANLPTMRDLGVFITPRRAAKSLDFVKAAAGLEGRDVVDVDDLRAAGLAYCVIGDGSGHAEIWNDLCCEYFDGLSGKCLNLLESIGQLTDFVGDLHAERGVISELEMKIGGETFMVGRRNIIEVKSKIFAGGKNPQPAVKRAKEMLDESIDSLSEEVHTTGVSLNLWTD